MPELDIAIIGAGPGGFEAALRAQELGFKVSLIEKSDPGGVCLNTGCIPTKALLASSRRVTQIKEAASLGLAPQEPRWDFASLQERKRKIVETLKKGMTETIKRSGIEWIQGEASFVGSHCLLVKDPSPLTLPSPLRGEGRVRGEIEARSIIIAAGSEPMPFPGVPFDRDKILSSTDLLEIKKVPERLLIIGGGVMGAEFVSIFQPLGSKVTVVEMLDRLIPTEDEEVGRRLDAIFRRKGVEIYTGEKVKSLQTKGSGVEVQLAGGKKLEADKVLVATGRKPRLEELTLDKAGVKLEKDRIRVDDFLQTSTPGVYAIGDVTSRTTGLAHGASAQGILVVENLKGPETTKMDYALVPSCIYTDPEVASVGLARSAFSKQGYEIAEAKVLFASLGKSQVEGEAEGFLKMLASKTDGRILGVTAIGSHVTELIHEAVLAMKAGLSVRTLAQTVHAHPTESEILQKAARQLVRHCFGPAAFGGSPSQ